MNILGKGRLFSFELIEKSNIFPYNLIDLKK